MNRTSKNASSSWAAVLPMLILPIAVGLTMYFVLLTLINQQVIENELIVRYVTRHPVSKVTTAMFFVGLAALLMAAHSVVIQFLRDRKIHLNPKSDDSEQDGEADRAQQLIDHLGRLPSSLRSFLLYRRLCSVLDYIKRTGSVDGLEDETKYLSDSDAERQHENGAFVRILIWATPMLGFLGTVLGISEALGGIQLGPDNDFQSMMGGLQSSLYVAFDTTALALTFSIGLMFIQFLVTKFESQLLLRVDARSQQEITSNFEAGSQNRDPYVRTIDRIGRSILAATHELSQKQMDMWRRSIEKAQLAWIQSIHGSHETIQEQLNLSLDSNIGRMSDQLETTINRVDESLAKRCEQWQVTLSQNARQLNDQNERLVSECEKICQSIAHLAANPPTIGQHHVEVENSTQENEANSSIDQTLVDLTHSLNLLIVRLARSNGIEKLGSTNQADSGVPQMQDSAAASRKPPMLQIVRVENETESDQSSESRKKAA